MDSCKIPLGESKWILALGREISDPAYFLSKGGYAHFDMYIFHF